ncbi:MAG: hypothetical protein A2Y87_09775 [Bacteroidetes bacterium RBG_13_46_8]|nr:MAG: hypothetical protein A2Y87_09775 [Bacteroidetes bacterium RBG_13_46_8]
MSIKENLINKMMGKQFENMTPEEKQQMMNNMMDNFFASMSEDEKKAMMSDMMPKMMGKMMGGQGGSPMMGMMSMMMGKRHGKGEAKSPMDCCGEMMSGFSETANSARFATPELRGLFNEWCQQIENEILAFIKETNSIDVNKIMEKISLSEESTRYILNRLASKNLIDYKI